MQVIPRRLLLVSVFLSVALAAVASPVQLRTEHMTNPLGLDAAHPALQWQSNATRPGWMQSAYQVLVATRPENLVPGKADAWDSGRTQSSNSVDVVYAGAPLKSQTRYFWLVRVWDERGTVSMSTPTWFETGLLLNSDWTAQWIRRADPASEAELKAVHWIWLADSVAPSASGDTVNEFHYALHLDQKPLRASLHVLADGSFVASVNGAVTGQHTGWSSFDWEEIGPMLRYGSGAAGANDIVVKVKPRGRGNAAVTRPALAAAIRLTAPDGAQRSIVSDSTWLVGTDRTDLAAAQELGPLDQPLLNDKGQPSGLGPLLRTVSSTALFRKNFTTANVVTSARLIIAALGAYHVYLNGRQVDADTLLNPGFTDFRKRVLYQSYDVTSMLAAGNNAIALVLGAGWHGSPLTWFGTQEFPGPELVRAQLDIALSDGSHQRIASDPTWKTSASPILSSEIYAGEIYDARLETSGWNRRSFDDTAWANAVVDNPPSDPVLTSQPDLPITLSNRLHPVSLHSVDAGHASVYDMGQNMVGNIALHVRGPAGAQVRMRFAERLNPDGTLYTENLRNATVADVYVLSGNGDETYTPSFTFHGFRYVELSGYPGTPTMGSIEGLVYNSLPAAPSIRVTSSSELLNKMSELGIWGQRGNFVSIPTDCPQRDERLGWMGDAGVFWRTGSYNFDIASFTHKFVLDIDDAQTARGAFTDVSPNVLTQTEGAPGWSDAGILVPYAAWLQYGDTQIVDRTWASMQRFMDFIAETNPDFLRRNKMGANYGDWLAPDPNTPKDLVATAYWGILAKAMQEMATALGRQQDAEKYSTLYERIAAAYRKEYVRADGSVAGNTQTGYVVSLYSGLIPNELRANMTGRLVSDIAAKGDHLTTGFLGTPFLMFALDDNQRADVAFNLLLQETYPSWGYMVKKGATTWWERWNGDTGDPSMNSYNHYAFGSVMAWVFRRAAGIDTDATGAGFHHLTIRPHFDPRLPRLRVEYDSAYGFIATDWDQQTRKFILTTPPNTAATVTLPDGRAYNVGSGKHVYKIQ